MASTVGALNSKSRIRIEARCSTVVRGSGSARTEHYSRGANEDDGRQARQHKKTALVRRRSAEGREGSREGVPSQCGGPGEIVHGNVCMFGG